MEHPQKASPTMNTMVGELSDCYDYFLRLSGFSDLVCKLYLNLVWKVYLIAFRFSLVDLLTIFCRSNVKEAVYLAGELGSGLSFYEN